MTRIVLTSAANAGVLLEADGVRLLLDGIRRCTYPPFAPTPPDVLAAQMHGAEDSPWRHIDHLVFSHLHPDHFDADATAEYLRHNRVRGIFAPEWPLAAADGLHVCAPEDGEAVRFPLAPSLSLTLIGTRHAGDAFSGVRSNACLIAAGARRILFVGDGDYVPEWYASAGPADTLFVNPLFLNSRAALPLVETLAPQSVWVHHLPDGREDRDSSFFWRVAERAARRFPEGLIRYFPSGSRIIL